MTDDFACDCLSLGFFYPPERSFEKEELEPVLSQIGSHSVLHCHDRYLNQPDQSPKRPFLPISCQSILHLTPLACPLFVIHVPQLWICSAIGLNPTYESFL